MSTMIVRCCTCGRPLTKVPAYLGEGDGARLFQCDSCFYPRVSLGMRPFIPDIEGRGNRLDAIIEDWRSPRPADAA